MIWDIVRLIRLNVITYDDLSDFDDKLQQEVKKYLRLLPMRKFANVTDLKEILLGALPDVLNVKQQSKKVQNIPQAVKQEGIVNVEGTGWS